MEIDPPDGEYSKEATLLSQITTNSPLTSSLAKLSGSSRGIPYEKDFHFYRNFPEFKHPVQEIDDKSKTLLERIGVSSQLWGNGQDYPSGVVIDDFDGYDWLVNINDDVLEQLDTSLEEFRTAREAGSGFQVVQSRKNKRAEGSGLLQVADKPKPKIPFHIPSIPRPQDEYKIIVNNANQPFEHVWLQSSEDGMRVHPLENCSVMDFVDKNTSNILPKKPESLQATPFTFVEDVKALKQLAAKLKCVDEFAVDLEHNQYRSFQGLTCLMQISTRTEDFVIDTLKLRIQVGPYLREVFKDPTKKKVLHGADRDILWLQRDFGIYVCNMFDTGQASRVLKLERNSLEYLLHHFCAVKANKEYQNAEWRLRPLPEEMVKYAREDTHYLLYIYDLMKIRLLSVSTDSESADPPLVEVYKRSYDICAQLYEKELLTEDSYLHIYGLQDAGFNAQQLAVVAGLCEWRDVVARTEDESTGYVLPNKTLLDIAKNMPLFAQSLRRLLKTKHPYVDRNLASVVSIIRNAVQNAAAFEEVAEQLKERHFEKGPENSTAVSQVMPSEPSELSGTITEAEKVVVSSGSNNIKLALNHTEKQQVHLSTRCESDSSNKEIGSDNLIIPRVDFCVSGRSGENRATIQVKNKPNRAFGALLGGSGKRKIQSDKKEDLKLEQIKSSVTLPFHSFNNGKELLQPGLEQSVTQSSNFPSGEPVAIVPSGEDFIMLEPSNDAPDLTNEGAVAQNAVENKEDGDEVMTLSDLSSSFQKCFPSPLKKATDGEPADKLQTSTGFLQLEPFNYEEAKKQVVFGMGRGKKLGSNAAENSKNRHDKPDKKITSVSGNPRIDSGDLPQGRRRQAFPASGNRSATFR